MAKPEISRKAFIRIAALAGIGAGVAIIDRNTQPVGALNFVRWMVRAQVNKLKSPAVVALGGCPGYGDDILGCLERSWELAEMPNIQGSSVLIKPNLVDSIQDHPATTAPEVVGGIIDLLNKRGVREIVVGDGSAFRRDTGSIVHSVGLMEVLGHRGVPFVDLNYDDPQPVKARDGWLRRSKLLWLPKHVLQADYIISIPKLKTHHWAGVSFSLKNLLGVLPGSRYGWPKNIIHMNGINASILAVYQVMPPVLAVVDGIVGMEGDGPLFGTPVEHGFLAVGKDPVSVDAVCAQLIGVPIDSIPYINIAGWAGVGEIERIETRGIPPEELHKQYQPPPTL
jgi:uncharacterized protein (DUF362 family)